ncbi:uncharacterized protein [Palaemon carinicauda]|uniref:uncharacterized protein n=1 Tax=Palaemon carinicauda TaxID=392227 RepID=UPI0035B5A0A7
MTMDTCSHVPASLTNLLSIILHQTIAYNPATIRRVECFHLALKAVLMSSCNDSNWFTHLPWVLLGLRTTPRDTLDVSAAEIVYGDPLVVPAKYFPSTTSSGNIQRLCHVVGKFIPWHQTYKPPAKQHIQIDLHSAMYVFMHSDTIKPLLIHGPFPRDPSYAEGFLINIRGKEDWVSIDRLKLAYLLPDDPPMVRLSKAGRPISHVCHF